MPVSRFSDNDRPKFLKRPNTPPSPDSNEYVKNEIDKRLDRITELWKAAEGKFLGMQSPRCVEYCYETEVIDERAGFEVYHHLGIQRHAGKWRLCYGVQSCQQPFDQMDWRPVTECSAELRVEAVKHLRGFKEHIIETGKKFIPRIDQAIKDLEQFLDE